MEFLLAIHHGEDFRATPGLVERIGAWIREMGERGVRIDGRPLTPAAGAVVVRVRDGETKQTHAPLPAEEPLAAFELIRCESFEEALEIAASHPMASAATIEVREVWAALADDSPT